MYICNIRRLKPVRMMEKIITDNLDAIIRIAKTHHVKALWLFGSAIGRGIDGNGFGTNSDIDFLVEFEEKIYNLEQYDPFDIYMETYYALKQLLGREVDLVSTRAENSQRFKQNVERTKQPIYA